MEIKILNKDEFADLIPLYVELNNKIFNSKVDESYFIWRYLKNPNDDLLVCAALNKGKLVANYSASEFQLFNTNNVLLKSAQSLNTMTDPEYQGQGLFVKTATTLYDEMERKGYDLIWGFPNNLSHWVFNNKLLWKDIYEYPTLSLKVNSQSSHNNRYIRIVNSCNIDSLPFSKYFLGCHYQINKTNKYLKWRYLDNPISSYYFYYYDMKTEKGTYDYVILKKYDNKLNIVELEAESRETLKELLDFTIEFAFKNNLDYVTIWSSINSKIYSFVESYGFWLDMPIFHLSARFFNNEISSNFHWNISQGDDNVF